MENPIFSENIKGKDVFDNCLFLTEISEQFHGNIYF
jgi:hypothetical protein